MWSAKYNVGKLMYKVEIFHIDIYEYLFSGFKLISYCLYKTEAQSVLGNNKEDNCYCAQPIK